jgi:hypothetical protein
MTSSEEGGSSLSSPRRHNTGAFACFHHNHIMARECSGHSGHDNSSTVGDDTVAGYQPPLLAIACSSRGATSASPRSATQRWVGGSAMAE